MGRFFQCPPRLLAGGPREHVQQHYSMFTVTRVFDQADHLSNDVVIRCGGQRNCQRRLDSVDFLLLTGSKKL